MNRSILSKLVFSCFAVAAASLPVQAQETPTQVLANLQAQRAQKIAAGENTADLDRQIGQLRAQINRDAVQAANDRDMEALLEARSAAAAAGDTRKVNGLTQSIEKITQSEETLNDAREANAAADSRSATRTGDGDSAEDGVRGNNRTRDPYDPYGRNRNGIGEKVVEGLFGVGTALLQSWLNGGQSDNERAAMDRMFANNDAAAAGANPSDAGTPIYGPNGEIIGYDRNDDNKADTTDSDGDGSPDTFTGGSYDDDYTSYSDPSEFAYDDYTNTDDSDAFQPDRLGNVGGGGASAGSSGGASLGGDIGGDGDDEAAEDEEGEDEEGEGEDEEGEGDDDDADLADADDDDSSRSSRSSDDDGMDAEVQDYVGRIFVLPKDAITNAVEGGATAFGNQAPNDDDGFSDDGWNDSDNGDWADEEEDDWGWEESEWGDEGAPSADPNAVAEPGVPAMGNPLTPEEELLKQEIIQVEAEIAKWQKSERDKKLQQEDPYAFETTRALEGEADDPFQAYRRPEDGKLDLTKVNVWIIVQDTWKEATPADPMDPTAAAGAQEYAPVRMRLIVPDELLDRFDPIQGGWVSLRGTKVEAEFNPAVFPGLKGTVQDLDLVQVLAVTKEQPADLDDTEYSDY